LELNVLKDELKAVSLAFNNMLNSTADKEYFRHCMYHRINQLFIDTGMIHFYYKLRDRQNRKWFSEEIKELMLVAAIQKRKPEILPKDMEKIRSNFYLMDQ